MAALTQGRNTPEISGTLRDLGVAAGVKIHAGSMVCLNAGGQAVPGSTSAALTIVGRAEEPVDNLTGAANTVTVRVKKGVFRFANSAAADLIATADIGANCYIVDDQTVAKTAAVATRSIAGQVFDVDTQGVWVFVG